MDWKDLPIDNFSGDASAEVDKLPPTKWFWPYKNNSRYKHTNWLCGLNLIHNVNVYSKKLTSTDWKDLLMDSFSGETSAVEVDPFPPMAWFWPYTNNMQLLTTKHNIIATSTFENHDDIKLTKTTRQLNRIIMKNLKLN